MTIDQIEMEAPATSPEKVHLPAVSTAPMQRGRPFARGQSGNPAGRKPGSKNRLTDVVVAAMADDFAQHGAKAIAAVRRDDPATYLRIISSFVPRELVLQREREPLVDLDSITLADLVAMIEQAERRQSIRMALMNAERTCR